ncbi:MAG: hypothetical protein DRN57_03080 [Thermoplasmata archaeon]|nr:MAG: hypothetical protein DRN57_03080 [Thermoplasmata archaeon]
MIWSGVCMNRSFAILISALLLVLSIYGTSASPEYDQGDGSPSPRSGPFLWTHRGPMSVRDLENVFSMGSDRDTGYWIVQFEAPSTVNRDALIRSHGYIPLDYFPDNGYVVKLGDRDPSDLFHLPGAVGASPFFSGLKASPHLISLYMNGEDPFEGLGSATVETFRGADIEDSLETLGVGWTRVSGTRYLVNTPELDLVDLLKVDGVKWIEPRSPMELFNNVADSIIDVDTAWDSLGLDGTGQVVAISDSGLDTGVDDHNITGDIHLDFDNRATIVNWAGSSPDDEHGHGTHVAGSVAGNGARSSGNIKGMAYNSSIYFQAIMDNFGQLQIPSNLSQLFTQSYNAGARVHTNSWGSQLSSLFGAYTTDSYDVDWSMWYHPDMLILFAAGNDGMDANSDGRIDSNSVSPPATAKSTLTVGASENLRSSGGFQGTWGSGWPADFPASPISGDRPSNNSNGIAAFSSRGPLDDGRIKPDVVAPGTNILSTKSSQSSSTGWGSYNSYYLYNGGTSMAAPITAGMAVLIRQFYNGTLGMSSPSAALMKATIINGATDLYPGQYGASSPTTREIDGRPDMNQGWGRINLKDSVDPDSGIVSFVDNSTGISTGENLARMFRVLSSDTELRLTLAWSDYPGSLFAGKQLINDLDLILYAPNGTAYRGNDFSYPFDDSTDSINPVEGIAVKSPSPGWWKEKVEGSNIPRGPQHFALVASGNISEMMSNMMLFDRRFYSIDHDTVTLSLTSRDLAGYGSVEVHVSSNSDPAGKNVTLFESGSSGAFLGSFHTRNNSLTSADELFVSHNDIITAEYVSPFNFTYRANATAKRPMRVALIRLDENLLTYSRHDFLHLKGAGDPGLDVQWTVPGSNLPWIGIFDDGLPAHGDEEADDGEYNVEFYLGGVYFAEGNITLRVQDPFLGPLLYEQFPITINSSMPGAPGELDAEPLPVGNTVFLKWRRSASTGVHHYNVFINASDTPPGLDESGWVFYMSTTGPENTTVVDGLVDGVGYSFRVAAVNGAGNMSSLSFWDSAVPYDITPPTVVYNEAPMIFSGRAVLEFESDDDLELLELQYYHDENMNGLVDDNGTFIPAVNSTNSTVVWDTRSSAGGPGDIERMILRFRGMDEVPNVSDWTYMGGFGVDNTPPHGLKLSISPPRVTNGTDFDVIGNTEPLSRVMVIQNGEFLTELTAGTSGLFDFHLTLEEGPNSLNLTAYDLHGAGPTYLNMTFTRDTSPPVAVIRDFNRTMEIMCNCTSFISDSYDVGADPEQTRISNVTWVLIGPYGATSRSYSRTFMHTMDILGRYELKLWVRDAAMNMAYANTSFVVVDLTPPTARISGPVEVAEDTTIGYSLLNSTDNDPTLFSSLKASVLWTFTGPDGFRETSDRYEPLVSFPDPGLYYVMLSITDMGGNDASAEIAVTVLDITPPDVDIVGEIFFDPGARAVFNASVIDNVREGDVTYLWVLSYLDGDMEDVVGTNATFEYVLVSSGNYTLRLTVTDASGNSRNESVNLFVRSPLMVTDLPTGSGEGKFMDPLVIFGISVAVIILTLFGVVILVRRGRYDDVEAEWEEEEDLDELDEVDIDDEPGWEDWDEW